MGEWMSLPTFDANLVERIGRGGLIRKAASRYIGLNGPGRRSHSYNDYYADLVVQYDKRESYNNLVDIMYYEDFQ